MVTWMGQKVKRHSVVAGEPAAEWDWESSSAPPRWYLTWAHRLSNSLDLTEVIIFGRMFWRSFGLCTRCPLWSWSGGGSPTPWRRWCSPCRGRRSTTPRCPWTGSTPSPRRTRPQVTRQHRYTGQDAERSDSVWLSRQAESALLSLTSRTSPKTLRSRWLQWCVRAPRLKTWPPRKGESEAWGHGRRSGYRS